MDGSSLVLHLIQFVNDIKHGCSILDSCIYRVENTDLQILEMKWDSVQRREVTVLSAGFQIIRLACVHLLDITAGRDETRTSTIKINT